MRDLHIAGAAGYAAGELLRLSHRHPQLRLGALESDSHAGSPIGTHGPFLRGFERRFDATGAILARLRPGDIVVTAGDAAFARAHAVAYLDGGARVVDLSDAFRDGARSDAVYGFPERYRERIRGAHLVANPGCYPTATLLALWPLAELHLDVRHIIVDAKSGITGAGRTPALGSLFAEVDAEVRAYGLDGHRHHAEIARELAALGIGAPLDFTPHVVPLRRGMLACVYAVCADEPDPAAVLARFRRAFATSPFVRVDAERSPSLVAVAGTNDAELHVSCRGNVVRIICAIDNLGKGAAGQALQNINIMLGCAEETGLRDRAIVA